MDEDLELLRRFYSEDPVPDGRSLAVLQERMQFALDEETSGAKTRRRFTGFARHRWAMAMPVAVAMAILLVVVLLPRSNESELGMLVTSDRITQPHFLDSMVSFSYLPAGFHLTRDGRSNKLTGPAEFDRTILFSNGTDLLSVVISQSSHNDGPFQPATALSHAFVIPTKIRGHAGEIVQDIPSSVPLPRGIGKACGPPPPPYARNTSSSQIQLNWIERQGVEFTVAGTGLSLTELMQVVNGIVYHRGIDACLRDGRVVSATGGCSAGTVSSPPSDRLAIPPGGTEIAAGTVNSIPWVFSAGVAPDNTNTWLSLEYRGQAEVGGCSSGNNASSLLGVGTALDGQRFAVGAVPDLVTSVTATSTHGNSVSQPVFPTTLRGVAFFALSLGKVHGICDDVCGGQVTFTFYRGGASVATVTVPGDLTLGGFPVPDHKSGRT